MLDWSAIAYKLLQEPQGPLCAGPVSSSGSASWHSPDAQAGTSSLEDAHPVEGALKPRSSPKNRAKVQAEQAGSLIIRAQLVCLSFPITKVDKMNNEVDGRGGSA